jgi:hypothetical protein
MKDGCGNYTWDGDSVTGCVNDEDHSGDCSYEHESSYYEQDSDLADSLSEDD